MKINSPSNRRENQRHYSFIITAMARVKKRYILVLLILIALLAAFIFGRPYIQRELEAQLHVKLEDIRQKGYTVTYDSITIDWPENVIDAYHLSIVRDSSAKLCVPEFIKTDHIRASGLSLFALLFRRHINFESVEFSKPHLSLVKDSNFLKDSTRIAKDAFTFRSERLVLDRIQFEQYNFERCDLALQFQSTVTIRDFVLRAAPDHPLFINVAHLEQDSITIKLPQNLYQFNIRHARLDQQMRIFDLDTLRIIPLASKLGFARKRGFEVDRFEGVIPYINLYDFSVTRLDSITLSAKKATVQAFIKIFRDKRLPGRPKPKLLPMEALKTLPVGLVIDSVILNKSFLSYEEYSEEADSTGSVFFDNLYATVRNVNNTPHFRNGDDMVMIARTSFMGQGDLRVKATFPWDGVQEYTMKGSMENLNFTKMNEFLEPAVKIRVESGHLNSLAFEFAYDHRQSQGKIYLDYNDLRLVTFKEPSEIKRKNRKSKKIVDEEIGVQKDGLKTFLLNAFIIKRDMDERMPEEKRSGTILTKRDPNKSVFNYWWKSVLSGLKSAYGLDKLEDRKMKRMLKKKEKEKIN